MTELIFLYIIALVCIFYNVKNIAMSEVIVNKDGKYESSLDNVTEELLWVKKQIQRELSGLQQNVREDQLKNSFFEKKSDKVEYHMDLVKEYLQSCVEKEDFQINSAVVMAVQIALESKWYDVGKIDWLLKTVSWSQSNTEKAINKFQNDNNIRVDWVPWRTTVLKILEKLWDEKVSANIWNKEQDKKQENIEWNRITSKELLALEIYRWKLMSNEEIEKMKYDPEEIHWLVHNKKMMEMIDKIIPKKTITKKDVDQKETLNKKKDNENGQDVDNEHNETWETTEILVWPRLNATNRKELWWIWSSIMYGIQWLGTRANWFTNMAWVKWSCADNSRFNDEKWKLYENFIMPRKELIEYCTTHGIKSFMFYFGWDEKTKEQREIALKNIEKWWEYLEEGWIQPVLCTCIGEEIEEHQDEDGNYYVKEYNKAIREIQQKKWRSLIDFVKIDELNTFRPNNGWYPWPEWYQRMWTKIEQCFSSTDK